MNYLFESDALRARVVELEALLEAVKSERDYLRRLIERGLSGET